MCVRETHECGRIRTAAEPTAACGGNREARLGQRSDFSKPRQGAAEKSANATRRCCLVRGSRPVGMSTGETFVFATSFYTMRRFLCPKNFGRPCRAPNPEVGCEPGGVINVLFENPSVSRFFLLILHGAAGKRIAFMPPFRKFLQKFPYHRRLIPS